MLSVTSMSGQFNFVTATYLLHVIVSKCQLIPPEPMHRLSIIRTSETRVTVYIRTW